MSYPAETTAPFYVWASRSGGSRWPTPSAVAAWTGAIALDNPARPTDGPGLVLDRRGLALRLVDGRRLRWHAGLVPFRLAHRADDTLLRALDADAGARVLDATLGLGHDAWVMAAAGHDVEAVEVRAPLLYFTLEGLRGHAPTAARRIRGRCGRFETVVAHERFDHVYLDPMFPPGATGHGPQWDTWRAVGRPGWPSREVLVDARRAARRSLVLKLPPLGPVDRYVAPELAGEIVASKRMRYMVWRR